MFFLLRFVPVARKKMAYDPNRFIPNQWLQAARVPRSSSAVMYDCTADTSVWPHDSTWSYGSQFWQNNRKDTGYFSMYNHLYDFNMTHSKKSSTGGGRKTDRNTGRYVQNSRKEQKRMDQSRTSHQRIKRTKFNHGQRNSTVAKDHGKDMDSTTSTVRRQLCDPSQMSTGNITAWGKQTLTKLGGIPHMHSPSRKKSDITAGCEQSAIPTPSSGVVDEARNKLDRKWEDIDLPKDFNPEQANQTPMRVMSYNILSQTLLELNRGLYRHCDDAVLPWEFRWNNIKKEITDLNADVLCLQEIEECHFEDQIWPFLDDAGYQCHYKRRTSRNPNKPDGVLTAFKKTNFELVTHKQVEYYRGESSLVNQHNVGVITLLRPLLQDDVRGKSMKATSVSRDALCVVNTHLLYSPRRGDVKLVQLATLFAEVHRIVSRAGRNTPIIFCGDLNSAAHSLLYDFITRQSIDYEGCEARCVSGQKTSHKGRVWYLPESLLPECLSVSDECRLMTTDKEPATISSSEDEWAGPYQLRHSLGPLQSVHLHQRPEASTTQDKGITVDYIFHTPPANSTNHASPGTSAENANGEVNERGLLLFPRRRLCLVTPRELRDVGGIPNSVHSSDHLPVVADFLFSIQ